MSMYSIGQRTSNVTTNNANFDVAASTGVRHRIMEFGIFLAAATASVFGLNRPSTLGTRTTPTALLAEDSGDPALTGINLVDSAVAWSAQPTLGAADLRRIGFPATIGAGVVWTFPKGLSSAASLPIAIVNRGATGVADIYAVADL